MRVIVGIVIVAFVLVACAGPEAEPQGEATPQAEPALTATVPEASRCEPASEGLVTAISDGLSVSGGGSLADTVIVKSTAFENAYFVAADIEGSGTAGREVGVWVTNDTAGGGAIYSVIALASEFSSWGPGGQTDAAFSMSDDGASEAEACVA